MAYKRSLWACYSLLLRDCRRRVDCQREVYHPEEEYRVEEEDPQLVGQERQVDERGRQKHRPIFEQRRYEGRLQLVLHGGAGGSGGQGVRSKLVCKFKLKWRYIANCGCKWAACALGLAGVLSDLRVVQPLPLDDREKHEDESREDGRLKAGRDGGRWLETSQSEVSWGGMGRRGAARMNTHGQLHNRQPTCTNWSMPTFSNVTKVNGSGVGGMAPSSAM